MRHTNNVLVTLDIDGTLIASADGGADQNLAIDKAAFEVFGIDQKMEDYLNCSFSGTTDYWIALQIANKAMKDDQNIEEKIQKFIEAEAKYYFKYFTNSIKVLPGVVAFVEHLNSLPNVTVALSTGNCEKIAWKKIESVNLDKYFPKKYGGFGEIYERSDILKRAKEMAEKGEGVKFDRHVHIGDAHQDVAASVEVGAIPIAVETGNLSFADFHAPVYVVCNLEKGFDDAVSIVCSGKPIHNYVIKS